MLSKKQQPLSPVRRHVKASKKHAKNNSEKFVKKTSNQNGNLSSSTNSDSVSESDPTKSPNNLENKKKSSSEFVILRSKVEFPEGLAAYILENQSKLYSKKLLNALLQAISGKSSIYFENFFKMHQSASITLIQRLVEFFDMKKISVPPAAHEFILHAECYGARDLSWPLDNDKDKNMDKAVFSPKDMLKRFNSIDPVGRLTRMIELCQNLEDLASVSKKLNKLIAKESYNVYIPLVARLISKCRRIITLTSGDDISLEIKKNFITDILETCLLAHNKISPFLSNQPLVKLQMFLTFCADNNLLTDRGIEITQILIDYSSKTLKSTALSMEWVMRFKSVTTPSELSLLIEELWNEDIQAFDIRSNDIFSSISSVLARLGSTSLYLREDIVNKFLKTQELMLQEKLIDDKFSSHDCSFLPRRVLRLIEEEQKQKRLKSRESKLKNLPEPIHDIDEST